MTVISMDFLLASYISWTWQERSLQSRNTNEHRQKVTTKQHTENQQQKLTLSKELEKVQPSNQNKHLKKL